MIIFMKVALIILFVGPLQAIDINCSSKAENVNTNICEITDATVFYIDEEAKRVGPWQFEIPPTLPPTLPPTPPAPPTTIKPSSPGNGTGNGTVSAGNGTATASNATAPTGNGTVSAGNGTATASNATAPTGNGTVSAGNGTISAGNGTVPAGNGTVSAGKRPPIPKFKEILLFSNCNMTYLPNNIGRFFPRLITLAVWFSGLKYLAPVALLDMPNLREVNLQHNIIEDIPEMFFMPTQNLTNINLGTNKLRSLPEKLLIALSQLESFIACSNLIEFLPAGLFMGNFKLAFVNLNNNKIKVIAVDFTRIKSLKKVLGIQNTCADFYLNNEMSAEKLKVLVKAKCSGQPKPSEDKKE